MNVLHLVRAVDLVKESMLAFRARTAGSAGSRARIESRSSMRRWISGLVVGEKFLRKPEGMVCLAVSRRTLLKVLTAVYMEVGGGRVWNLDSEREVNDGQSARLKLV